MNIFYIFWPLYLYFLKYLKICFYCFWAIAVTICKLYKAFWEKISFLSLHIWRINLLGYLWHECLLISNTYIQYRCASLGFCSSLFRYLLGNKTKVLNNSMFWFVLQLTCRSFSWHCFSSTSVRSLRSSAVCCSCSFSSSIVFTRRSSSCLRSDNIFICTTRAGEKHQVTDISIIQL